MKKKFLALVLVLALVLSLGATFALADNSKDTVNVTVVYKVYDSTTEDSGGTHVAGNLTNGGTKQLTADRSKGFDVELEKDWGVINSNAATGIEKAKFYNADGSLHYDFTDSFKGDSATVEVRVAPNWTSRFAQFAYISDDGIKFEYASTQVAAAPTDGNVQDANNYDNSSKLDGKGVQPNAPEGYHYAGRYFFAYVQGPGYTPKYGSPEEYGLSIDANGVITGATPKITGDEQFYVLYYYVKDGEELKGTLYKYFFFDGQYDAEKTVTENPVVGSVIDTSAPYFYGYKLDNQLVKNYAGGAWKDYSAQEDGSYKQPDGTLGLYNYYVSADKYAVTYVSNENGDGKGTSYDGGEEFEQAPYTVLGNDTVGFVNDGYRFTGWNTEADGSGTAYAADDEFTMPAEDVTLYAQWEQLYTVTYTDGVDGEEVFADQVTGDLTAGTATPAFDGTPAREGYTFKGWDPEVADTVTGDAVYTAQWEAVPADEPKKDDDSPKTGDESNMVLWALMAVAATSGAGIVVLKLKEEK